MSNPDVLIAEMGLGLCEEKSPCEGRAIIWAQTNKAVLWKISRCSRLVDSGSLEQVGIVKVYRNSVRHELCRSQVDTQTPQRSRKKSAPESRLGTILRVSSITFRVSTTRGLSHQGHHVPQQFAGLSEQEAGHCGKAFHHGTHVSVPVSEWQPLCAPAV